MHAGTRDTINEAAGREIIDRANAKSVNFGLVYGLVESSFKRMFGDEIGSKVYAALRARFAGMEDYRAAVVYQGHLDGYVRSLLGRKRRVYEINHERWSQRSHAERQLFNAKVQSSASDIVKLAQIALYRRLPELRQFLQVHDEINCRFRGTYKQAVEIAKEMKRVMENVVQLAVPLVCDPKAVRSWAEAK
jgi:DNA polymerase-1